MTAGQSGGASRVGTPVQQLRRVLAEHPHARVSAVTAEGQSCPVPAAVTLAGTHVLGGTAGMLAYVGSDRAALIHLFEAARRDGHSSTVAHLLDAPDDALTVHMVDLLDSCGVVVVVVVPTEDGARTPVMAGPAAVVPVRLARITKSGTGGILAVDDGVTEILGWTEGDLIGRRSLDIIHPDDHGLAIESWFQLLARPTEARRIRVRHLARDGRWVWFDVTQRQELEREPARYVADMVDISEEMRAQQALEERERLLSQLATALPVGMAQVDDNGAIAYANQRLFDIFGLGANGASTLAELTSRLDDECRAALGEALQRVGSSEGSVELDLEVAVAGATTSCHVVLRRLPEPSGQARPGSVLCAVDMTEEIELRRQLQHRASTDALTGCANRATVLAELDRLERTMGRPDLPPAVLYIDLDGFKVINDSLGHAAGDQLLMETAHRIRATVPADATVGRLGGDEFLVVLPHPGGEAEVDALVARLRRALRQDLLAHGRRLAVTASIGSALGDGATTAAALVRRADEQMYAAKRRDHGCSDQPALSSH